MLFAQFTWFKCRYCVGDGQKERATTVLKLSRLCRIKTVYTDYREHTELRIRPKSRRVHKSVTDYCVPGNAVPTGNDPCPLGASS